MGRKPSLVVRCPQCEQHVTGVEEGAFEISLEEEGYERRRHTLLSCPECNHPFLVRYDGDEQMGDFDGFHDNRHTDWGAPILLYPGTTVDLDAAVPAPIAASYVEALRCYEQAGAYTATAILCRRTLEGICSQFLKGEKRNLASDLKLLREKGHIDARIFEWANEVLRALGNDAAHDVEQTIERQDAKDALDFTRAIIEYLFVFQSAFTRFKARQAVKELKNAEPS